MALRGRFCHKIPVLCNPQKSAILFPGPIRLVANLWQKVIRDFLDQDILLGGKLLFCHMNLPQISMSCIYIYTL